jgi:DNA polymerase I-like protein with 3'-5' exonuclease and polymerase domains/uracil-DNA glycosylase
MFYPACKNCALRQGELGTPVLSETHDDDRVIILGEAPGMHETVEGRPFVGPSGLELQAALNALNIPRDRCYIANTVRCRPPKNDLEALNIKVSRINRKREKVAREKKEDAHLLKRPVDACRSLLLEELKASGITRVVCMGKTAAKALRGGDVSIMNIRGGCELVEAPWDPDITLEVGYTMHPAWVLRQPAYREVFRHDLRKAFRFFSGTLDWLEPKIVRTHDPEEVRTSLKRLIESGKPLAYDLETDGIDPMVANVRCVGIGNEDESLIIGIRSIDGSYLATPGEISKLEEQLKVFFLNPGVPLLGHNAGQYDRLCVESWLGITPNLTCDTILLHLLADNELPHNLGFVGSFYTDNPEAWKADHTAVQAKTDEELHIYCGKDVCVTARIALPLARDVRRRKQQHLLPREHMLQSLGATMESVGMGVDLDRATEHLIRLDIEAKLHLKKCQDIVGEGFNPQSTQQMANLLFSNWGLAPHHYSEKTGDPSTDDETLRTMIVHYGLEGERIAFLRSVRTYRKVTKLLGTYVRPLIEKQTTRIHPSYNRLPATGRYSSSNPNAQNIPYSLRDIFVAREGCVLIGADMDQLELRLIAEEARAKHSIRVIQEGLDPHNETMEIVYGKGIWKLEGAPGNRKEKGKGVFKATRDITKNTRYAWQYAASTKRIHEQIVSVEDDEGNLLYSHLTIEDVRQVVEGLKRADPEIPRWWRMIEVRYRKEGFIGDSLWDRRRYFRNEDKINELVNHPIQSGGVVIVNEAMLELIYGVQEWFATEAINPTKETLPVEWLINHGHDALYLEVPEGEAKFAAEVLGRTMNRRRKVNPLLNYTSSVETGNRWSEV